MVTSSTPRSLALALRKELERAQKCDTEKALLLIEQGADPRFRWTRFPIDEISILGIAIKNHSAARIISSLLQKQKKIEKSSQGGWSIVSPLQLAVRHRHADAVRLLLKAGVRDDKAREELKNDPVSKDMLPLFEDAARRDAAEKREKADIAVRLQAQLEAEKKADLSPAWSRPVSDQVMRTALTPSGKSRLMDVFNFSTRERILITENLSTGVESPSAPVGFDDINKDVLKTALAEFTRLGGEADIDAVFRKKFVKPPVL